MTTSVDRPEYPYRTARRRMVWGVSGVSQGEGQGKLSLNRIVAPDEGAGQSPATAVRRYATR